MLGSMSRSGVVWVQGPRRWVPLVLGLLLAISAFIAGSWSKPLGAGAVAAALVYLGTAVPAVWRERQDRAAAQAEVARRVTPTATDSGRGVRTVREVPSSWMRRRAARLDIPYQRRDAEEEARMVLRGGAPLLLVGPSMAGKSRLGEELLRSDYPDLPLWIPEPSELPNLLGGHRGLGGGVARRPRSLSHRRGSTHRLD